MHMSEEDFANCTPKYYRLRLEGMRLTQQQQYRNQWEIARWQSAMIMSPHLKRAIEPTKLVRFPWEKAHEDIVAVVVKYKDIFAKLTPPTE